MGESYSDPRGLFYPLCSPERAKATVTSTVASKVHNEDIQHVPTLAAAGPANPKQVIYTHQIQQVFGLAPNAGTEYFIAIIDLDDTILAKL